MPSKLPIEFGGAPATPTPADHGPLKLFVRFTPADPEQPLPVDVLLGFMQAALNDFFWRARIGGRVEITQIGGDVFIVGASGEAVKG